MIQDALAKLLDGVDLSRDESRRVMDSIMSGERDAGADRRLPRRAAAEGRDGGRDRRRRRGDARRTSWPSTPSATTSSTPPAPAATAGGRSTSRPRRRSSQPPPAQASRSTATALSPRSPAAPTCSSALGFELELSPERIAESIDELGFGFMFAPAHHPAMKHAGPGPHRARDPYRVQRARAADEPRRRARPGRRRLLGAARAGDRRRARRGSARGAHSSCTAPAGSTSCRRPGRNLVVRGRRRQRAPARGRPARPRHPALRSGRAARRQRRGERAGHPRRLRGRGRRPPVGDPAQRRRRDRRGRPR